MDDRRILSRVTLNSRSSCFESHNCNSGVYRETFVISAVVETAAAGFTLDSRPFLLVDQTVFRQHVFCIRFLTTCWPLEGLGRGTQNLILLLEILALALLKKTRNFSVSAPHLRIIFEQWRKSTFTERRPKRRRLARRGHYSPKIPGIYVSQLLPF